MRIKNRGVFEVTKGKDHLLVCCVCGSTHGFRIEGKGKVAVSIWRDDFETIKESLKAYKRLTKEGVKQVEHGKKKVR